MNNPKLRFRDDSGSRFVDWQKVSFGKTFSFLKSSAFSRAQLNYRGGQIKNVHYGDILVKFPTILNSCCNDVPYVNPAEKTEKYDLLQVGDIVIADTAEDLTVGKAIEISDVSNNIIAGLHTIACRPQRKFANRFLGYYLNSKAFHNQLVPLATGIKVYSIIKSEIVKTRINVPCLEEQQKIASFFSTLDEKIELSERKLEALEQLKKGLIQKIFSQEIRFKKDDGSEFPVWKTGLLSDYVKASGGHTPSMKNREFWNNGKWYWVTSKDMKTDYIRQSEMRVSDKALESLKLYEPKTLLLVARSGILKHSLPLAMLECQATINQDIKALEVSKILPEFLFFYLKNREHYVVKTLVKTGTTVQSLMLEEFYKLTVFEPCMEEQKKIASFFITLDKKIQITSEKIRALKKLKQGFMQQMFV